MTRKSYPRFATRLALLSVFALALVPFASAEWKEKVLYSFQGGVDGSTPAGGVVFDKIGNLYGTTTDGGSDKCPGIAQCGTVFQLQPPAKGGDSWTENQLYIFKGKSSNDGETPAGGVILDQAGNLYGTTAYGGSGSCVLLGTTVGCGTVFQMKPPQIKGGAWTETVLYSFQGGKDGYVPQGNLAFDSAGNLYGVTLYGGGYGSCNSPYYQYCGTVFKLSPPKTKGGKWKEKVLYSFKGGTDGANPNGGLVFDGNGRVYGTTFAGGNQNCRGDGYIGCGTAFELKVPAKKESAWTERHLHIFSGGDDGGLPSFGVILDTSGAIYGAAQGGPGMGGIVFRLAEISGAWKETIVYGFNSDSYSYTPAVAVFDKNGNLYGTTNVGPSHSLAGSVFRLRALQQDVSFWSFSLLYGFTGVPNAALPNAGLVFDKSGDLYGTTTEGGTGTGCSFQGCGTVFEVEP